MKDNLKIAFLFVLIIGCVIFIFRNVAYKNFLILILPFLSFYLGKIYESKKGNKNEETPTQTPQSLQPPISNIPQEFKDEQKRFEEMTK